MGPTDYLGPNVELSDEPDPDADEVPFTIENVMRIFGYSREEAERVMAAAAGEDVRCARAVGEAEKADP